MTEQDLNILLRLNLEIDGALRTYASRSTVESLTLLKEKVAEFSVLFDNEITKAVSDSPDISVIPSNDKIELNKDVKLSENVEDKETTTTQSNASVENSQTIDGEATIQVILDEGSLVDAKGEEDNKSAESVIHKDEDTFTKKVNIEKNEQLRVEDVISIREAKDITKAFTLNDKFRFLRRLFCDNQADFNDTLHHLQKLESLDEAYDYLLNELEWDVDNEEVQAFIGIIAHHFNEV